ncbi:ATP-binding cassette domain-containing protein [Demequina gelatinilytica]|uniref:ATP-binding cassette domain-containing protein n=1 Tax=Demequina gelatinilytica TaxID=1638980 RepID=UPI00078218A4|nr:ABC transporter ATP-binding protein [Demequina gelatinilytica]
MLTYRPLVLGVLATVLTALLYLRAGRAIDDQDGAGLVLAALVLAAVVGASSWYATHAAARDQVALEGADRSRLVRHVIALGPVHRTRAQAGRLVSTATDAVERSAQYRATFLGSVIGSLLAPLAVVVIVAVAIDLRIALLLLAAVPVVPLAIWGFRKLFRKVSTTYRASARRLAAEYLDSLQGLPTLRGLGAGRARGAALAVHAERVRADVMRLLAGNQLVLFVTDAVFSLAMIVLATGLAMAGAAAGTLTAGEAIAVVLLSTLMTEPVDRIGQFFYIGMGGIASGKEIARTLAQPTPRAAADAPEPTADDGSIVLEDVTFTYGRDASAPVLDGFALQVRRGERVVLAGRSGAGKSTVLGLIQGHLAAQSGTVKVGGHDVRDVSPAWLHRRLGIVAQQTYLFTGSLAENLRLAAPEASERDLWEALRRARLEDEVRAWPRGLDTPVGERGMALSGGQAQRVGIARALLADAPILLLDEPTSQTDLDAEAEILAAIAELCEDRTVLAVGHTEAVLSSSTRIVTVGGAA